ncbi:DNA cytosine methyltransferase [Bradyrhizobium sp. dw_78]|uniref:DNA cytosine methyltransferase n=1 Tax=Bradyrhizobium sp. dw_78 TaxID=2719793 RepID=UPI001BD623F9|nr:DNA cytosine methyltransferase [Bradyrhizobium sp. dw_78]
MAGGNRPSLVSLFAGAGGLDIGLEQAGFRTVLASEFAPHACETLRINRSLRSRDINFDHWFALELEKRCHQRISPNAHSTLLARGKRAWEARDDFLVDAVIAEGDVRQLSKDRVLSQAAIKRGELDLMAGGPPCQPFSRSGKRETVTVDDGRLFLEFVRLVDEIRPRWFLFENVKGLAQTSTDVEASRCAKCSALTLLPFELRGTQAGDLGKCSQCGGALKFESRAVRGGSLEIILNEFERIGYSCKFKLLNAADFGAPQSRERIFIVGSRDGEAFSWPEPTHSQAPKSQLQLFASKLLPWATVKDTLWKGGHWQYGKLNERTAVLWVKNVVRPHDEPVTWPLDRIAPTVGAHQSAKLAIAPLGVPPEQLARQQWHTQGRRQGDTPPVFVEHEYLTDDELLALQTFPDTWYLAGTRMERAFQIGNAVPPVLAKAVGEAIARAMGIEVSPLPELKYA